MFAVYMLLTQVFIIAISALNLFKPYVSDTFLPAMIILIGIAIYHLVVLIVVAKSVTQETTPKWAVYLAVPLLLTALTGNLFALYLAIVCCLRVAVTTNLELLNGIQCGRKSRGI